MTIKNEKALAGAGNTNEGASETGTGSTTYKHSSRELRRAIGKVQAAISNNNRALRQINEESLNASPAEFQELDADFGEFQRTNTVLTKHLRSLIEEHHQVVQQERDAAKQHEEEKARHDARKREVIARVTGHSDWSPMDLQYMLVERYREGGDYMTVLDAMKAIDDLDLERAGLNSWGEGDD